MSTGALAFPGVSCGLAIGRGCVGLLGQQFHVNKVTITAQVGVGNFKLHVLPNLGHPIRVTNAHLGGVTVVNTSGC